MSANLTMTLLRHENVLTLSRFMLSVYQGVTVDRTANERLNKRQLMHEGVEMGMLVSKVIGLFNPSHYTIQYIIKSDRLTSIV